LCKKVKNKNGSLQEYTNMNDVDIQQQCLQKACKDNTTVKAQINLLKPSGFFTYHRV